MLNDILTAVFVLVVASLILVIAGCGGGSLLNLPKTPEQVAQDRVCRTYGEVDKYTTKSKVRCKSGKYIHWSL